MSIAFELQVLHETDRSQIISLYRWTLWERRARSSLSPRYRCAAGSDPGGQFDRLCVTL